MDKYYDSDEDDEDIYSDSSEENEESRGSHSEEISSDYCGYESDRGSDGEEETDCDEGSPYEQPPLPKRRKNETHIFEEGGRLTLDGADRLTALPEPLILHILSFLSMNDAVRTGTLSKRWQYLWTSVENISFNYRYYEPDQKRVQKFITFVDKTLVLCTHSSVKKFSFDFAYERRFVSNVNLWVRFATQKNVQELDLNLYTERPGHRYLLPQHVYYNSALVKLSLSKCKIRPYNVVDWRSLRVLTIKNAELTDAIIWKIVKGSPALEFLELYRCWVTSNYYADESGYGLITGDGLSIHSASLKKLVISGYRHPIFEDDDSVLKISAPNVLSLEIRGYLRRKKIQLVNVSSLVDAKLDFNRDIPYSDKKEYFKETSNMLTDLLTSLKHVKDLSLGSWCMQVLSVLEVKGLPSPLFECTSLTLVTSMGKWCLPGIASLLQSSPDLKTLVIDFESDYYEVLQDSIQISLGHHYNLSLFCFGPNFVNSYDFVGESYWESHKGVFLLLHLKTVKVIGLRKKTSELELAVLQFLLVNAPVLEKMVINGGSVGCKEYSAGSISPEVLQVTQRFSSFPRYSPSAVIMFPELLK